MFSIVEKRQWYFLLSALIIIPGLVAMVYSITMFGSPVKLSIDFTGGTLLELRLDQPVQPAEVREVFVDNGYVGTVVTTTADGTVLVRTKPMETEDKAQLMDPLRDTFGPVEELRFESVGPAVGAEVTRTAAIAVAVAALFILLFIIFAFRKVPNAFRYGVCAIAAMIHDILVTVGLFSIAGLILGWEADALFLTAILTVIGFSVQYTIVVFDRIRENIPKRRGEPYETIVNRSLLETIHRSLATQLNAIFVLVALLIFGGATMKQFVAVLLVGLLSGTYSSIFNAVPLLVVWQTGRVVGRRRKATA
ncbi:MAG TPA: protein translocase subunit SecF [Anaerolineae bacterium]|nr:protein translocase subunit SecF [Anaerolineae bacterium]